MQRSLGNGLKTASWLYISESYLFNENSKHQIPNLKQIPMTKIQNFNQVKLLPPSQMVKSLTDKVVCSDTVQPR